MGHNNQNSTCAPATCVGPYRIEFAADMAARIDEFRLRYAIFVEERGYLAAEGLIDKCEIDEHDAASCAFLVRDAATGEAAACQRFVLPERLAPGQITQVELVSPGLAPDLALRPRDSWAEASRSSVAPRYRWGSGETTLPAMVAVKYASLGLALALGRDTLFSVSDPRTARLTRRLGVPLHQVGPIVDYHGPRAPFRIEIAELLASVPADMQDTVARLTADAARVCSSSR